MCIVLCTLELAIGWGNCCHWCGMTGLLRVSWFQRVSEFPMGSGSGGGHGAASCWGCSQLCSRVNCAMVDHAVALLCRFLAALTEVSHCHLSLCERVRVWSIVARKSALDALGNPLVLMLYCSLPDIGIFMQFGWLLPMEFVILVIPLLLCTF